MTFEEFFTRKRIDLAALQRAEPVLFSEFRSHFEQMGEKSFDHTKKYWFNKLRHLYHLAPEAKPEKIRIANPLAEQTINESLSETVEVPKPAPRMGFVPKFKAANMAKSAVEGEKIEEKPVVEETQAPAEQPAPSPKLGFTPKFRAANPPKAVEQDKREEEKPAEEKPSESNETSAIKLTYKPRFNMKNMPPKKEE